MEYKYPQINRGQGYAWNMVQRINNVVGLKPTATGDSNGQTFINFSRDLTTQEKTLLDRVIADNPTQPPTLGGTKFVIKDVFNQKSTIQTAMEFPYKVYYSESVLGSGNVDQIEIHFDTNLTTTQKNKVLNAYANLISVK